MPSRRTHISAIDLFCGAGGLSRGLEDAGVNVVAGIDLDPHCKYPFEANIDAEFIEQDVRNVSGAQLKRLWAEGSVRLLAGCAPCQPFSPYRRGADTSNESQWPLLREFGRLVRSARPELVTMENVPRIGSTTVFAEFVQTLESLGYEVVWKSCNCVDFGLPQSRRRLVLIGSRIGRIELPTGPLRGKQPRTVRDVIADLPAIKQGEVDPEDALHRSRTLSPLNLKRIRASKAGGTWHDWPVSLRSPCHRAASGATFRNPYSRMEWDKPSPTITTLAHNYGTGRFGHPEQDRAISLREAAMLQGFPRDYAFLPEGDEVHFTRLGRLIGNAVPPPIGEMIGEVMLQHVSAG